MRTMAKPIISAYLTLTPDMRKFFRSKLRGYQVNVYKEQLSTDNVDPKTEILAVFVDSKVPKKLMDAMPKLKRIVTLSTGFDHVDVKAAKRKKIPVCNVPSYGENTVAEFAVGLMLSLSRQLFPAVKRVKEGNFDYHGLRGMDIKGKTIGIIGTGKIGLHTIEMLRGFNANIIAFDAFPKKELQKEYDFSYVSKTALFKQSDIISLHLPLFDSTYHMLGKRAIKQMKPGVLIVNTARGGLIDSEALVWGLEKGIVAGAGLDVLEGEDVFEDPSKLLGHQSTVDLRTTVMNNILIDHPNTIVTPHNAFNSVEAVKRIISTSVQNIKADEAQHNVWAKR